MCSSLDKKFDIIKNGRVHFKNFHRLQKGGKKKEKKGGRKEGGRGEKKEEREEKRRRDRKRVKRKKKEFSGLHSENIPIKSSCSFSNTPIQER